MGSKQYYSSSQMDAIAADPLAENRLPLLKGREDGRAGVGGMRRKMEMGWVPVVVTYLSPRD